MPRWPWLLWVVPSTAQAAFLYTPSCPPSAPTCADYPTLEDAVAAALPGDVIRVTADLDADENTVVDRRLTIEGFEGKPRVGPVDVTDAVSEITLRGLRLPCTFGAPFSIRSAADKTVLDDLDSVDCSDTMPIVVTGDELLATHLTIARTSTAVSVESAPSSLQFSGSTFNVSSSTFDTLPRAISAPLNPSGLAAATLTDLTFREVLYEAVSVSGGAPLVLAIQNIDLVDSGIAAEAAIHVQTAPGPLHQVSLGQTRARAGGPMLLWTDNGPPSVGAEAILTVDDLVVIGSTAWSLAPVTASPQGLDAAVRRSRFCQNIGRTAADLDLQAVEARLQNVSSTQGLTWAQQDQSQPQATIRIGGASEVRLDNVGVQTDLDHALAVEAAPLNDLIVRSTLFDVQGQPLRLDAPGQLTGEISIGYSALVSDNAATWANAASVQNDNLIGLSPEYLEAPWWSAADCSAPGLRLALTSPLRDVGDPASLDLDGSPTDIGAWGGALAAIADQDNDGTWSDLDCDDADPARNPFLTEVPYDGIDQDCDLFDLLDADQDGFVAGIDCDDAEPLARPGGQDVWYDGIDGDCDGADDFDQDDDGFRDPSGGGADCDDTDPAIHPSVAEVWYDGIDQNCDGNDLDRDGDGHLTAFIGAGQPVEGGDDCDDQDPNISPSADEIWYDGVDQDCQGDDDVDQDGDGYVAIDHGGDDCDDLDVEVNPGAEEDFDPKDLDCDGWGDPSGPVAPRTCSAPGHTNGPVWAAVLGLFLRRQRFRRYSPPTA